MTTNNDTMYGYKDPYSIDYSRDFTPAYNQADPWQAMIADRKSDPKPEGLPADVLERFLSKISHLGDGCWLWTAQRSPGGYGQFKLYGRKLGAHVVSYRAFVGPIADGLELDHLCRNRACVNPLHLEAVRHRTNVLRGLVPVLMPILKLGNKNWQGRTHSDGTRALMSIAAKGKKKSPQHCANMSKARLGMKTKPHSVEAKAKMSVAKREWWKRKKESAT